MNRPETSAKNRYSLCWIGSLRRLSIGCWSWRLRPDLGARWSRGDRRFGRRQYPIEAGHVSPHQTQIGEAQTLIFSERSGAATWSSAISPIALAELLHGHVVNLSAGALLTALSWNFASFALFRMLTGMAIGGEYAAINSAIDELIPARLRGRVDLAINGTALARRDGGLPASRAAARPEVASRMARLAFGVWTGGRDRVSNDHCPPLRAGEPALADDAWPTARSRKDHEIDRGARRRARTCHPSKAASRFGRARRSASGRSHGRSCSLPHTSPARTGADRVAGVLLQRHLVQLSAGTGQVLLGWRRTVSACLCSRWPPPISSGRCCSGHFFDTLGRRRMIGSTYVCTFRPV